MRVKLFKFKYLYRIFHFSFECAIFYMKNIVLLLEQGLNYYFLIFVQIVTSQLQT